MRTLVFISLSLLSGVSHATSFQSVHPASESHAVLYVYHYCTPKGSGGGGANISVDDVRRAYVFAGTYFGASIPAGHHDLKWSGSEVPTIKVPLTLVAGMTYYVRVSLPKLVTGDLISGGTLLHTLEMVNPAEGEREIQSCEKSKKRWLSRRDFDA